MAGEPPAFAPGGDGQAWHAGGGRELLAVAAKQYEPAAWEKEPTGVMAYLLGIVYLFLGIAIVCDDYFVASLEVSGRARPVSLSLSPGFGGLGGRAVWVRPGD